MDGETVALGAGTLAGLAALVGGLYALARRREPEEEDEAVVYTAPEPPVASTPEPASLPPAFDLARYGPHMQAAYRGPTADNPSLSLRKRLKRAGCMDQRLRRELEQAAAGTAPTPGMPELELTRPASPILDQTGHIVAPQIRWNRAGLRAAFQS